MRTTSTDLILQRMPRQGVVLGRGEVIQVAPTWVAVEWLETVLTIPYIGAPVIGEPMWLLQQGTTVVGLAGGGDGGGPPSPPGTTIHTGYGPPTADVGNAGDFYLDQDADTLYGPKSAGATFGPANNAFAAKTPASNVSASPGYVIGNRFHMNSSGRISALRFWKAATTTTTHTIKLWRESDQFLLGQSVPTTEVSGSTGWIEGQMVTPVDVLAGIDVMVSLDLTQTYSYIDSITTSETPHFNLVAGHYGVTMGAYPPNGRAFNHFTDMAFRLPAGAETWPIAMAPGAGVNKLQFTFASPLATWVLNHNLNTTSIEVNCYDLAGTTEFDPEVEITNANTATVKWYYPTTGIARIIG